MILTAALQLNPLSLNVGDQLHLSGVYVTFSLGKGNRIYSNLNMNLGVLHNLE